MPNHMHGIIVINEVKELNKDYSSGINFAKEQDFAKKQDFADMQNVSDIADLPGDWALWNRIGYQGILH